MRIDHLHLLKYGHFDGVKLEFPKTQHDLHLIVGDNEAGKTTLRKAVLDWLFGIPAQSDMAIGYEKALLSVAGKLSASDGKTLEYVRRKARQVSDSLRDMQDRAIPLSVLDPFLPSALQRDAFERMFCMGVDELRAGVNMLIDSNSDDHFARVLWQSTSGIPGLQDLEKQLIAEAAGLYEPGGRKKGGRRYDDAAKRHEEQRQAIKQRAVSASSYDTARRARDGAYKSLKEIQDRQKALRADQARLQRVRATAPDLDEYRRLDTDLKNRSPVPGLEAGAQMRVDGVVQAISLHQANLERETSTRETQRNLRDGFALPENHKAMIDGAAAIVRDQRTAEDAIRDLPVVEGEQGRSLSTAIDKAQGAGFTGHSIEDLRRWLPAAAQRSAANDIIGKVERANADALTSLTKAEEKAAEVQSLRNQVASLPPLTDVRTLTDALSELSAAAIDPQRERELQRLRETFQKSLKALGSFATSLEALDQIDLPSLAEARDYESTRTRLDTAQTSANSMLIKLNEDVARAHERIARASSKASSAISPDALLVARQHRDTLWQSILMRKHELELHAPDFEGAVENADRVADERFSQSEAAHEIEAATLEHSLASDRAKKAEQALEVAANAASTHREQWAQRLAVQKLKPLGESDLQMLVKGIDAVREQARVIEERSQALDAVTARHAQARVVMCGLLSTDANDAELLFTAQQRINEANQAVGQQQNLSKLIAAGEAECRNLELQAAQRVTERDQLHKRARTLMIAASLAADVDPLLARNQIAAMNEVEIKLEGLGGTAQRIEQMKTAIEAFRTLVETVRPAFGVERTQDVLADARAIRGAADQLQERKSRRAQHEKAFDAADALVQKANKGMADAKASVANLMAQAGAESIEDLARIVAEAAKQDELRNRLEGLRRRMVQAAGGVRFEDLADEIDATDRTMLAADLEAIDQQINAINPQLIATAETHKEASGAVEVMGNGDELGKAEVARQMAIADMRESVDRFVEVRAAAEILRWALRRYRQQAQGPMLSAASAYFSKITLGRYQGLMIDLDSETPELLAVLANSKRQVRLNQLSEGTRLPLYLALRLASINLYLQDRPGMVFIADDLFVDMDEERSAAGFEVLGDIATRGQVLYLSHHQHLDPIARAAVPSVNVTTLKRPADLVPAGRP